MKIYHITNYKSFAADQPVTHDYLTRQIMVNKFKIFFSFHTYMHRLNIKNQMLVTFQIQKL